MNPVLYEEIKKNNNVITTAQVLSLGFSRTLLVNYVKEGLLERVRHGIYMLPDTVHDDMYTLMLCSEKVVFSHETALFLHGLSERVPFMHSVTIPSNAALPASLKEECNCYYIAPDLHQDGIVLVETTFGNKVRCYDAERTICDLLRSRSRVDEETIIDGLKKYAARENKDLNRLGAYAEQLHVEKTLRRYLEVLL